MVVVLLVMQLLSLTRVQRWWRQRVFIITDSGRVSFRQSFGLEALCLFVDASPCWTKVQRYAGHGHKRFWVILVKLRNLSAVLRDAPERLFRWRSAGLKSQ